METKHTSSYDQRPSKEIIKQWWPSAHDEFDANPEANSHAIWVVACLLYSADDAGKIIEKAEELLYLCQHFRIPCDGDPLDRTEEYIINPMFPEIKGKRYISGLLAKLSKETVKKHLQDYRLWPLAADVPLSKWWERQLPKRMDIDSQTIKQLSGYIDKKNPVIGNVDANSGESPEDSIIKFVKTVLIKHQDAKTADLRRNCFENIEGLNSRDSQIINKLLVKAGAKKSKKGEHAKDFVWESKYPRAQWERVFNKKKKIANQ